MLSVVIVCYRCLRSKEASYRKGVRNNKQGTQRWVEQKRSDNRLVARFAARFAAAVCLSACLRLGCLLSLSSLARFAARCLWSLSSLAARCLLLLSSFAAGCLLSRLSLAARLSAMGGRKKLLREESVVFLRGEVKFVWDSPASFLFINAKIIYTIHQRSTCKFLQKSRSSILHSW
jgi:hypothetical protein